MKKQIVFVSIIFVLVAVLSSCQLSTVLRNQLLQQQFQLTNEADKLVIREIVVKYVTSIQTYDYRKIKGLAGLEYCTPSYKELVEKSTPQIISRVKRDRETHKVEYVQIDTIDMTSLEIAYVTYRIKGIGTNLDEKPVSVDVRGDIVCRKIAGKWLIDLDDLEPREDVLVHIFR